MKLKRPAEAILGRRRGSVTSTRILNRPDPQIVAVSSFIGSMLVRPLAQTKKTIGAVKSPNTQIIPAIEKIFVLPFISHCSK